MIKVDALTITLRNQEILKSVSCSLAPGRITTFIGKSGAGKTTLLKSMAGLITSPADTIIVNGQAMSALSAQQRSEEIGYVFQDFNLFPHFSVLRNCVDPLLVHGMDLEQAEQRAREILQQLDMQDYADVYPSQLSGGQQQRVAIARALCLNPRVLLLDEPTASLDPVNTDALVKILQSLAAQGLTIGLSSQDMSFVRKVFDRVYYMQGGHIVEQCDGIAMIARCPLIAQFV